MLRYLVLIVSGALVSVFLLYYVSLSEGLTDIAWPFWVTAAFSGSLALVAIELISVWLDRLLPWRQGAGSRMLAGMVLISLLILLGWVLVSSFISLEKEGVGQQIFNTDKQLFIKLVILTVIFSLVYSIIYFARISYTEYAGQQVEAIKTERQQIDLQLKVLKSQLSPHFLFNSLNSVSSLVHSDVEMAEQFVRKLAHMYQYVLQSFNEKLVDLKDELAFANAYHHLLRIRFGDRIELTENLSQELLDTRIPPVTLQLLLENAVKHNVISETEKIQVEIRSESGYLVVENNITTTDRSEKSHKVGLGNIKSRYKLLTDKRILVQSGDTFKVKLPLIR